MPNAGPTQFWNRQTGRLEVERVYGDGWLRWAYETALGRLALKAVTRPWFSRIYGAAQSSAPSRLKVPGFIRRYGIAMEEFEGGPFGSFNDFFIRRFKSGARTFDPSQSAFPAFAEGRYFAFDKIRLDQTVPIKGTGLSAARVLGGEDKARPFLGGPVLVARLCPVDYHRYHYPDDGSTLNSYELGGALHSVHPVALAFDGDILAENHRRVVAGRALAMSCAGSARRPRLRPPIAPPPV